MGNAPLPPNFYTIFTTTVRRTCEHCRIDGSFCLVLLTGNVCKNAPGVMVAHVSTVSTEMPHSVHTSVRMHHNEGGFDNEGNFEHS